MSHIQTFWCMAQCKGEVLLTRTFGLAEGVLGKTPLYLAVKVSFRVALEGILKNYIFSIRFIYLIHVIKV